MAKILVAANDKNHRGVFALLIECEGHKCKVAGSLQETLNLLRNHSVDLVIAEFKLDGASWDQTVKSIRTISQEVSVMILANSSDAAKENDKVLVNVNSHGELIQHINHVLGRKS